LDPNFKVRNAAKNKTKWKERKFKKIFFSLLFFPKSAMFTLGFGSRNWNEYGSILAPDLYLHSPTLRKTLSLSGNVPIFFLFQACRNQMFVWKDGELAVQLSNSPSPGKENQFTRKRRRTGPLDAFLTAKQERDKSLG
jgi:hypothetical protein